MIKLKLTNEAPGLLVSVRSAAEALAALAGGADVIDVKEPNQGSLGAADDDTISGCRRGEWPRTRIGGLGRTCRLDWVT